MPLTTEEREIVRKEANVSETSKQCLQPMPLGELGSISYCVKDHGHSGRHRTAHDVEFDDSASAELLPRIKRNLLRREAHRNTEELIVA